MGDRVTFTIGEDRVGVVSLNRPEKLNAMDIAVFDGLHGATSSAQTAIAEGSVRAVLIKGEGRAFSAGLDVSLFAEQAAGATPDDDWIAYLQQAFTGFEDLAVPVVAAVRGVAYGGGCQLALAAHLRLATPDAQLALLEANWAIIPDLGGVDPSAPCDRTQSRHRHGHDRPEGGRTDRAVVGPGRPGVGPAGLRRSCAGLHG